MFIKQTQRGLTRSMLHITQLFLYTITADILISELAFILGRVISWYFLPLSFLAGILCLVVFYGEDPGKMALFEIIAAVLIFLIFAGVCGKVYDFSYDGNAYHKVAIGLLKNHWNPMQSHPDDAHLRTIKASTLIWVECYAKSAWILAAGIYGITGNIECGKAYTMIAMACVFCITYYCLKSHKKSTLFSTAYALAAALNPVAIQQMDSFYVDGYLHLVLFILVLSLAMLATSESDTHGRLVFASITACAMIICGTIKFTGLLYGGIYCSVYFIYYCCKQIWAGSTQKQVNIRKCFCLFAVLAGVTVLWAGADTYVMNVLHHGSPVYPLYGEGAMDIMTDNSPFGEVNHVKNLFISLFSKMSNTLFSSGQVPELKIPFTVDWPAEVEMHSAGTRISGFGVLFSGIFLISMAAIAIKIVSTCVRKREEENRIESQFWLWLLAANVGLCLIITESWWARYAPYIYFTVLLGVFFVGNDSWSQGKTKQLRKCLQVAVLVLLLSNNLIFFNKLPGKLRQSAVIRREMYALSTCQDVTVASRYFLGTYFNFEDQRVSCSLNYELPENSAGTAFPYMDIQVCAK